MICGEVCPLPIGKAGFEHRHAGYGLSSTVVLICLTDAQKAHTDQSKSLTDCRIYPTNSCPG